LIGGSPSYGFAPTAAVSLLGLPLCFYIFYAAIQKGQQEQKKTTKISAVVVFNGNHPQERTIIITRNHNNQLFMYLCSCKRSLISHVITVLWKVIGTFSKKVHHIENVNKLNKGCSCGVLLVSTVVATKYFKKFQHLNNEAFRSNVFNLSRRY